MRLIKISNAIGGACLMVGLGGIGGACDTGKGFIPALFVLCVGYVFEHISNSI